MVDAVLCGCIADVGFGWYRFCVDLYHYPVIMVSFMSRPYLKTQLRVPLVLSSSLVWFSDCMYL